MNSDFTIRWRVVEGIQRFPAGTDSEKGTLVVFQPGAGNFGSNLGHSVSFYKAFLTSFGQLEWFSNIIA